MYICIIKMDTRTQILQKNFQAICVNGFQGTRTDKVLAELGITKGAFYHYFPDKSTLGYAIVDEILFPMYVNHWLHLSTYTGNPIDGILASLQLIGGYCNADNVAYGCPLNNLIQEMSPIDAVFRDKLQKVVQKKHELISKALLKGQQQGNVSMNIKAEDLAYFILSALEGSFSMAKVAKSTEVFEASLSVLVNYLKTLKT